MRRRLYKALGEAGFDTLYDETGDRAGAKVCSHGSHRIALADDHWTERGLRKGAVELKERSSGERASSCRLDQAIETG